MADEIKKLNVASSDAPADDVADDPFAATKDELVTRFQLLPDDIKAVITDAGYQQKLFELAKSKKLTYEELGILETETTMVLLGMTKPADYRSELQAELKMGDADMDAIVAAVNEQVFLPIRASLERVYAAKKEPADYIPESIVTGVVEKPKEPVFPPQAPAIHSTLPGMPSAPRAAAMNAMPFPSKLSSTETSVLEKAGVSIAPQAPAAPAAPMPEFDRKDLLASIENPSAIKAAPAMPVAPAAAPTQTVATPLPPKPFGGPVISPTKTTDYSMPKPAPTADAIPAAPTRASDPYREPIN